jgi:formylglycine-generating enzyme
VAAETPSEDDATTGTDWVSGEMVSIPGGVVAIGSDEGDSDEWPTYNYALPDFNLDVTEVTVEAYQACVDDGACTAGDDSSHSRYCNTGVPARAHHPINCVDWYQASAYCAWVGKRLPQQEEWEHAARGNDYRTYPWGDDEPSDQLCWSGGSTTRDSTCPVGAFPEDMSPFGVMDMGGNVWEWTWNLGRSYYASSSMGSPLFRGGSWLYAASSGVRASDSAMSLPWNRGPSFGFRCAIER